jgi:ATP-dependent Clp protease protease subunit
LPITSSPTIVPPPLVGVGVASFSEAKGKHVGGTEINNKVSNLTWTTTLKNFKSKTTNPKNLLEISEKALGQRHLRKQYTGENFSNNLTNNTAFSKPSFEGVSKGINNKVSNLTKNKKTPLSYLEFENKKNPIKGENSANVREYYRKQNERIIRAEEEKKVFVIINSFGGSVGNGITVHDALQFIKAGSLTLGLGVAASASSLVLAGGTITERFVTEGCHTMIHQPEGGLNGQASDIWIDSHEIMKIRLDVAEIYSLSAQRPRHKILRDLDRDFYLTANETIAYGLADEIATNEVMHEIIEMTRRVWDYQDVKQQRLLEARNTGGDGLNTQTQN